MKVGFIIVLYQTPDHELIRLRREIMQIGFTDYKIYEIDNSKNNQGYSQGLNKGISLALKDNVELFIVLNPDISITNISQKEILAGIEHFDLSGFALKQEDKTYYGGEIDPWRLSGGLVSKKSVKKYISVDFIPGSLMVIKKSVIKKIGYFDESFFMYYEDVDYCKRARSAGLGVGINSSLYYQHFGVSKKNPDKDQQLATSWRRFFLKNSSFPQKIREFIRLPKTILENRSRFFYNFFSLNLSSLINKVLHFIWFIFLVRILTTADYGIYSLVWAQIALLSPLLDLGTTSYGVVYLPTENKKRFRGVFLLRIVLSLIVFVLTIGLAYIFHYPPRIIFLVTLLSFVIITNGITGSLLILNSINEKLYISSILSIVFNLILIPVLIISLLFFKNLESIFIANCILYLLYGVINFVFVLKEGKITFNFSLVNWRASISTYLVSWFEILKKSYVFVLISLFAGFYYKADIFLLNFLKGQQAVGIYSSGYKFLDALMFIAGSYNIAVTPLIARLARTNITQLKNKLKKDFILLGILGLLVSVSVFIFAPYVLPFFLKGQFGQAITVVKIVIFALPLVLITSVCMNVFYVFQKAYWVVYLFLTQIIINIFLNLIFIPKYSFISSSYISVVAEIVNTTVSLILLFKILRLKNEN